MLALMAIFAFGAVLFSLLDAVLISVVSRVWQLEHVIVRKLRDGGAFFSSKGTLVAEIRALEEALSSLKLERLSLLREQTQQDTLLELVGRKRKFHTIAAAVLTYPPQTPYDVIIIDAGSNDSVTLGSEVSLPEGPILGLISEVFPKKARVKLFSAVGEKTNAVLERNNVPVVLVGAGGGNFRFFTPRDIAVIEGDRILSSDITSRLLAIVGEVSVRSTDSFKEVLAKSPTNVFALRLVFVTP